MQESHQGKKQDKPEENGPVEEIDDPSLPEEPEETEEEEPAEEEEEDELVEEPEDEDWAEEDEEKVIPRRGCLKGCLAPIAVVFVILLVLIMIAYSRRDTIRASLLSRIIANTQNQILSKLPDDMDEKAVEAAFERLKTAMKEKQINEEVLTEAIEEYQDATQEEPPLEEKKQAINRLIDGLNAAVIVPEE